MSGDVWGVLIHHPWCLGRDLGPLVINSFRKKNRTSGNGLISILALSDRQKDASGTHLDPFSYFFVSFFISEA
jgi:hypothetical protein